MLIKQTHKQTTQITGIVNSPTGCELVQSGEVCVGSIKDHMLGSSIFCQPHCGSCSQTFCEVSPLTVEAERRHAGGTVENGVAVRQTLRLMMLRPQCSCWSFSAVIPAREDEKSNDYSGKMTSSLDCICVFWINTFYTTRVIPSEFLLSPPGVHPGLVPVILIRVIQQFVISRYDPLSLPPACGAACTGSRQIQQKWLGYRFSAMMPFTYALIQNKVKT